MAATRDIFEKRRANGFAILRLFSSFLGPFPHP